MNKVTIEDIKFANKTVFLRADFNVPLKDGVVSNDNRIVQSLKTINYLLDNNAKVIVVSHLGKVKHSDPEQAAKDMAKNEMTPVYETLTHYLGNKVFYCPFTKGKEVEDAISKLDYGQILLLQNTRYEKGEEKNDSELAAYWASLCDIYVNDAFGTCHRAHASTYGVPEVCIKQGKEVAIGYLVEKEVNSLFACVEGKDHPYVAILGGAKVSDKIKMIEGLLNKADKVIIGGAMAYTFIKAMGNQVGSSLVEDEQIDFARSTLAKANGRIILPTDHIVVDSIDTPNTIKTTERVDIPDGFIGVDIGPKTIELYKKCIGNSKIIFWNGPMGIFEDDRYANGTKEVCHAIGNIKDCFSVVGGGDSASAVAKFKCKDCFSHVSTGGGASAEMIENDGHLPGIDIIKDK